MKTEVQKKFIPSLVTQTLDNIIYIEENHERRAEILTSGLTKELKLEGFEVLISPETSSD